MNSSANESHSQELAEFENGSWTEVGHELQSLPRVDGGKDAWLFLTGCFLLEALVWGSSLFHPSVGDVVLTTTRLSVLVRSFPGLLQPS